jgi:hypothetical protein
VSADFLIYARLFGVDSSSPAGKLISSFSYPAIYNLAVDFGASDFSVVAAVVAAGVAAGVAADEESDGFKAASWVAFSALAASLAAVSFLVFASASDWAGSLSVGALFGTVLAEPSFTLLSPTLAATDSAADASLLDGSLAFSSATAFSFSASFGSLSSAFSASDLVVGLSSSFFLAAELSNPGMPSKSLSLTFGSLRSI